MQKKKIMENMYLNWTYFKSKILVMFFVLSEDKQSVILQNSQFSSIILFHDLASIKKHHI